jgi:hypothetical protein
MPEKTIKRRLTEAGARELADDDGPIFPTVAKLVAALRRTRVPARLSSGRTHTGPTAIDG